MKFLSKEKAEVNMIIPNMFRIISKTSMWLGNIPSIYEYIL